MGQANLLTAMRSRLIPVVLAGLVLLALLPVGATADENADSQLDQVTDLMRVGLMDEALADLTAMQDANPDHIRSWLVRGLVLGYMGRADEGRAEANARLAADPADGGGLALTVGLAIAEGDVSTAKEVSARLTAAHPESADAWDIRGGVLSLESGETAAREAMASFDRALAIDPQHIDALINRGELAGPTDPDEAERFLRRAVEARPESTDANDAWATFLIGQNRTADAIEAFDQWLGKQPGNPIALMGKASVLAVKGRYDEALWLVENVVRDDPGNRDGLYLKGELLFELGRLDEAVEAMSDLLEQYPGDEDAEALRSEAAAAVQSTAGGGNATRSATTPAAGASAPLAAALLALAALGVILRRRR